MTEIITIDARKVGVVIGPKGVTKLAIQEKTGVVIEFPPRSADKDKEATEPVPVTIRGPSEGVKKAAKNIKDLTTKGYCALLEGDNFSEGFIQIPPVYLSDVIGPKGASIKAIQEQCGVHLHVPPTLDRKDTTPVKINIAGPKDKVVQAKAIIKELTKYRHHPITHPTYVHIEMTDIAETYHRHIIGVKGGEIKHIQHNFKVNVYIPNADSHYKHVLIVGDKGAVDKAEAYIHKIVENAIQKQKERESRDSGAADDVEHERVAGLAMDQEDGHEDWMSEYDASKRATTTLDLSLSAVYADKGDGGRSGAPRKWQTNPAL